MNILINVILYTLLKNNKKFTAIFTYLFFAIFLTVGVYTFRDYGISIDEEFHRLSGFYWLDYALSFTDLENLKEAVKIKLNDRGFTVPDPKHHPFYGVIFDIPMALIEVLFNINQSREYFFLRHFANFSIFFIGAIYFFKILKNRFFNIYVPILGTLFFVLSPRIYGHSYFNNKDLIFLSLATIAVYYCFIAIDKINYKNLLIFSLFSALATASRLLGLFLPVSFLILFLMEIPRNKLKNLNFIIFFIFFYFLFLFIFWPVLWENTLISFGSALKYFSQAPLGIKTFFNGNYVDVRHLPINYSLFWIIISTPIIYLIFFTHGYAFKFKRVLKRFFSIEQNSSQHDLWRGKNEKKDFFIFFNLTGFMFYLFFSGVLLYTGWRQSFFLNIFIIYFSTYSVYLLFKINKKKLNYLSALIIISLFINLYQMIIYHPYQNTYFNFIGKNFYKNKFEADYWGLSAFKALNQILEKEKNNNNIIKIGVAAWYPVERSAALLKEKDQKRFNFVGQDYDSADYIFTNFISEVDKKYNNKYKIPNNFKKIFGFQLQSYDIYEIYKKIN